MINFLDQNPSVETDGCKSSFSADVDAEEESEVIHDPLHWNNHPDISSRKTEFRNAVLWPHIFAEEERGLQYMYYLDHLRVVNYKYA